MDIDALNDLTKWPSPDSYRNAQPFPHAVIDGFLRPEIAAELAATFPAPGADCWYRYANPLERKLACNVPGKVPSQIWETLSMFNSVKCRQLFSDLTGIEGLEADHDFHGGGMHCIESGGKLPPELASILAVQTGQAGRTAGSLDEVLGNATSQQDMQNRLAAENYIFLEDSSPSARVRAFDWLVAQHLAPAGYDPLAPARQRRKALDQAEQSSTAKQLTSN